MFRSYKEMDSCSAPRKTCFTFIEEDDGLASLEDVKAGYSRKILHPYSWRSACYSRSSSLRNLTSLSSTVSSPRSVRFYDARFEDNQPHFLEACFLCKKPLGGNRDIFMYRGDTPFCSEECRQEQIEIDEAEEKWNLSSSMKALRKKDQKKSSSPTKAQNYPVRTGTVAAA